MNHRLFLLVLTHGVLAVGAFAWGWRMARGQAGAAAAGKPPGGVVFAKPAKIGAPAQEKAAAREEPLPETGPEDPAAFVAWAKALEEESGNPFGNNPAHDQLRALFHRDRKRALQIALLARQEKCEMLFSVFAIEWAKTNFRDAVEWAKHLAPEAKTEAFTALVGGISAENATEVVASFLPELPRGYPRDRTLRVILTQWSSNDPAACFAWVQSLPAPDLMGMITRWSRNDSSGFSELVKALPDTVAAFVRALPNNENSLRLMQDTAGDLVAVDPPVALAWAGSLESAGARASCLTRVLREWVQTDLAAATAAALAQPEPGARQWAIEAMASQALANLSPAEARKWIDSLPADVRLAAEAEAVDLMRGPAAGRRLTELLDGPTATAEDLPKVARSAGASFALDTPEQAAKWVEGLPSGDIQIEAAAGVVSSWARLDPVATSEWVSSLPQGGGRDGAAESLAEALAASDPDTAFKWAESIASPTQRAKALRATIGEWKKIDLLSARRTIEASVLTPGEKAALVTGLDR